MGIAIPSVFIPIPPQGMDPPGYPLPFYNTGPNLAVYLLRGLVCLSTNQNVKLILIVVQELE